MPEPIVAVVIAVVSAIVGAVLGAIAAPWGKDFVARMAEERAGRREAHAQRVARIERVGQILVGAALGTPSASTDEREWLELPIAAGALGDSALSAAVDQLLVEERATREWMAAHRDATTRVGQLLIEADRDSK